MLRRIQWSHFIGINLPHNGSSDRAAEKKVREFINRLSRVLKTKPELMFWLAAYEFAPSGFNPHLHMQIGGPSRALNERQMQVECDIIARKMHLPRIRVEGYEDRPNAVQYLFKDRETPLDDDRWPISSPNIRDALRRGRM